MILKCIWAFKSLRGAKPSRPVTYKRSNSKNDLNKKHIRTNKYMTRQSTSLIIMQKIKTSMRQHFTPSRMPETEIQTTPRITKDME